MGAKKRKAPAQAKAAPATKKVRIGDTSTIGEESLPPGPSGRPRRSTSNDDPQYNFTNRNSKTEAAASKSKKSVAAKPTPKSGRGNTNGVKRGPGRPRKQVEVEVEVKKSSRKRGRNETSEEEIEQEKAEAEVPAKKRGRPAKSSAGSGALKRAPETIKKDSKKSVKTYKKTQGSSSADRFDTEDEATAADDSAGAAGITDDGGGGDEDIDDSIQYWLMKAEPESRIEKGHDVRFSIDDLAARTDPEGWDGVRNPAARNNMRAMRRGDLAFFYHSNCAVPGVAGVMRIVEEHSIDESAFDPDHPYFDAKSTRDKPKWELVKVEFVKKFDTYITLKELRKCAESGGGLEGMQMLRQSRLSVSAVRPAEWRFILDLAGERYSLGHGARADGYESDVDGEGEGEEGEGVGKLDGGGKGQDDAEVEGADGEDDTVGPETSPVA